MKKCEHKGCEKTAKFNPVIKVWAIGYNKGQHKPARAVISLAICADHMEKLTVDDFITDDGWNNLFSGFIQHNKAMPDRASAELGKQKIRSKNIKGFH